MASRKQHPPSVFIRTYFPKQKITHKDSRGIHRLLVGPFTNYRQALTTQKTLIKHGSTGAFIRFSEIKNLTPLQKTHYQPVLENKKTEQSHDQARQPTDSLVINENVKRLAAVSTEPLLLETRPHTEQKKTTAAGTANVAILNSDKNDLNNHVTESNNIRNFVISNPDITMAAIYPSSVTTNLPILSLSSPDQPIIAKNPPSASSTKRRSELHINKGVITNKHKQSDSNIRYGVYLSAGKNTTNENSNHFGQELIPNFLPPASTIGHGGSISSYDGELITDSFSLGLRRLTPVTDIMADYAYTTGYATNNKINYQIIIPQVNGNPAESWLCCTTQSTMRYQHDTHELSLTAIYPLVITQAFETNYVLGLSYVQSEAAFDVDIRNLSDQPLFNTLEETKSRYLGLRSGFGLNKPLGNKVEIGLDNMLTVYRLNSELIAKQTGGQADGNRITENDTVGLTYRLQLTPYLRYKLSSDSEITTQIFADYWKDSAYAKNPDCLTCAIATRIGFGDKTTYGAKLTLGVIF